MAVTALIKLVSATYPANPGGRAIYAVPGDAVTVTNDDNTDVQNWTISALHAEAGSGTYTPSPDVPQVLAQGNDGTPTVVVTPDIRGCIRLMLEVDDGFGNSDVDIRNIIVPERGGTIVPPYQLQPEPLPLTGLGAKPDEMNVNGQAYGWAGRDGQHRLLSATLRELDELRLKERPIPLVSSEGTTNLNGFVRIGGGVFDPGTVVTQVRFQALMSTSDLTNLAEVMLWDFGDSRVVHTLVSTGGTTDPEVVSANLTVGNGATEVRASSRNYGVFVRLQNNDPGDSATCLSATLERL